MGGSDVGGGEKADGLLPVGLGMSWVWRARPDAAACRAILEHAVGRGIRWFDVSPSYGDAEARLGEVVAQHPGELRIVDKYYGGDRPEEWGAEGLRRALHASLTALSVDSLDVYLLHNPPEAALHEGLLAALMEARDDGLVGRVGVSADGTVLQAALRSGQVDAAESSLNIVDLASADALAEASAEGVLVFAKRALANAVWLSRGADVHPYKAEYVRRLSQASVHQDDAAWLDTAARFAGYGTPADVAFFSTSKPAHIDAVVDAVRRGPLPDETAARWWTLNRRHPEWGSQP